MRNNLFPSKKKAGKSFTFTSEAVLIQEVGEEGEQIKCLRIQAWIAVLVVEKTRDELQLSGDQRRERAYLVSDLTL